MKTLLKLSFLLSLFFVSCHTETAKQNHITETIKPESEEYKAELAKRLRSTNASDISFTFEGLEEKKGTGQLHVTIEANTFNAVATLKVTEWDEALAEIRETNGKGYHGSEMNNLKIGIQEANGKTEFIYKGMEGFSD